MHSGWCGHKHAEKYKWEGAAVSLWAWRQRGSHQSLKCPKSCTTFPVTYTSTKVVSEREGCWDRKWRARDEEKNERPMPSSQPNVLPHLQPEEICPTQIFKVWPVSTFVTLHFISVPSCINEMLGWGHFLSPKTSHGGSTNQLTDNTLVWFLAIRCLNSRGKKKNLS